MGGWSGSGGLGKNCQDGGALWVWEEVRPEGWDNLQILTDAAANTQWVAMGRWWLVAHRSSHILLAAGYDG